MPWLIVGIAGCTCSGKSTLARAIVARLERLRAGTGDGDEQSQSAAQLQLLRPLGKVQLVRQDDYFFRRDRPEHTWIPGWNYINREIMSALDMERMCADIDRILLEERSPDDESSRLNVLLIEGFLIFNHATVRARCALRFDLRIPFEECRRRRLTGHQYNPPNPPGYFEQFIWPFYQRHLAEYAGDEELVVLDGRLPEAELLDVALHRMDRFCRHALWDRFE